MPTQTLRCSNKPIGSSLTFSDSIKTLYARSHGMDPARMLLNFLSRNPGQPNLRVFSFPIISCHIIDGLLIGLQNG